MRHPSGRSSCAMRATGLRNSCNLCSAAFVCVSAEAHPGRETVPSASQQLTAISRCTFLGFPSFVAATLDFVADVHFDWLGMWGLCGALETLAIDASVQKLLALYGGDWASCARELDEFCNLDDQRLFPRMFREWSRTMVAFPERRAFFWMKAQIWLLVGLPRGVLRLFDSKMRALGFTSATWEAQRQLSLVPSVQRGLRDLGMNSIMDWKFRPASISLRESRWTHPLMRPIVFLPGLEARPFYDPGEFKWARTFERQHPEIQREFDAAVGEGHLGEHQQLHHDVTLEEGVVLRQ